VVAGNCLGLESIWATAMWGNVPSVRNGHMLYPTTRWKTQCYWPLLVGLIRYPQPTVSLYPAVPSMFKFLRMAFAV